MGRSKSIPMRLDKFEYSSAYTETPRTPSKEERKVIWNKVAKRYMKAMGYIGPKIPSSWSCKTSEDQEVIVEAHTKGEARAKLKDIMGIPAKGRLPMGLVVTKVPK